MAKILLIDDDVDFREMLCEMLKEAGHQVAEAGDGVTGLRVFRKKPCHLVITDLMMPEKDGLETIRELRKEVPDLPIIAISGGGRSVSPDLVLRSAAHLGANKVLTKPFSMDEMVAVIGSVLKLGK